jgi:hypothetical protein
MSKDETGLVFSREEQKLLNLSAEDVFATWFDARVQKVQGVELIWKCPMCNEKLVKFCESAEEESYMNRLKRSVRHHLISAHAMYNMVE